MEILKVYKGNDIDYFLYYFEENYYMIIYHNMRLSNSSYDIYSIHIKPYDIDLYLEDVFITNIQHTILYDYNGIVEEMFFSSEIILDIINTHKHKLARLMKAGKILYGNMNSNYIN